MLNQALGKAHHAYQQAVYCHGRMPFCWISIGKWYYNMGQNRDSLDALATSVRLNPYVWESWYNLGILVSGPLW